jgi:hypothetical protein
MTIDQLRRAATAEPFRPFTVSPADGRRFFVPHGEFIWVPPQASRTFHVAGEGEDDESMIDLLLVSSLDFGNGAMAPRNRKREGE